MLVPRKLSSHGFYFRFRQWTVFHQADLNYIFPISFSEAAYGAHVTHIGTDNDTAAIIRALDQRHVEIGIGKQSGHDAYVIIYGK